MAVIDRTRTSFVENPGKLVGSREDQDRSGWHAVPSRTANLLFAMGKRYHAGWPDPHLRKVRASYRRTRDPTYRIVSGMPYRMVGRT